MKAKSLFTVLLLFALGVVAEEAGNTPLGNEEIVTMLEAGLGEEIVLAAIRSRPSEFDLSSEALVSLRDAGVPEHLVGAMLETAAERRDAPVPEVVIPDGTVVRLRLIQSISSADARAGDPLLFTAAEDILVEGELVIEEGANARGTVTAAKKRRSFGRKGKLDISIDYVTAVNRQKIGLRASHEARGKANYATAGVVTYLTGPFGAFVKGKNVTLRAGEEFTVFIDGDRRIRFDW